jgi:hypothetical protein
MPPVPDRAAPEPARRGVQVELGVDAFEAAGWAPKMMPGLAPFIVLRGAALSIGLEARFGASLPSGVYPPSGRVEMGQAAATVVPCVHFGPAFLCPVGEIGWIEAWGSGLAHNASQGTPLVTVGVRAGVRVPLGGSVFARFYAEGAIDLDRPQVKLDYQEAWTASLLAGSLGIGLGANIP